MFIRHCSITIAAIGHNSLCIHTMTPSTTKSSHSSVFSGGMEGEDSTLQLGNREAVSLSSPISDRKFGAELGIQSSHLYCFHGESGTTGEEYAGDPCKTFKLPGFGAYQM